MTFNSSINQPTQLLFGSSIFDGTAASIGSRIGESYRAKQREKELEQEIRAKVLAEMQMQRPDLFVPQHQSAPTQLQFPAPQPIRFGMHQNTGQKTFVTDGFKREELLMTGKEKLHYRVKQALQEALDEGTLSRSELHKLNQIEKELRPGAKISKTSKEWLAKGLGLGTGTLPGGLGVIADMLTKPVAAAIIDLKGSDATTEAAMMKFNAKEYLEESKETGKKETASTDSDSSDDSTNTKKKRRSTKLRTANSTRSPRLTTTSSPPNYVPPAQVPLSQRDGGIKGGADCVVM